MERSVLGRSVLVLVVLVATLSLTGGSSFSETAECRTNPGPPSLQGMHWYYRVDRTNNRHCWYLHSAGIQVRSHEIVPISKSWPQIVAEQPLTSSQKDTLQTSPSQPATAAGVLIEPNEPPAGAPAAAHFTARWLDLPASVDLGAVDFARPRSDYAVEHASADSEEPGLSTSFVAADPVDESPHKSIHAANLVSISVAGAISMVLFGGALKRMRCRILAKPRLKSQLDDGSEISLSELMQALRRVDETLKASETRRRPSVQLNEPRGRRESLKTRSS
jgi:hypothetical protein